MPPPDVAPQQVRGRYEVFDEIASGGMGAVFFGRLVGPVGFARTVAIKRLHPHLARDPEFVSLFLDEARLASRIRHPNVVPTIDVVIQDGDVLVVMDYVHGQSVHALARALVARGEWMTPRMAAAITTAALDGLHAAHEAQDEQGRSLELVHRDVSPQNLLVGADGTTRVLDFGIAKASLRSQTTRDGHLKGKVRYMSPEQVRGDPLDRRSDVFSAGVVFWELLTGRRLFDGDNPIAVARNLEEKSIAPPSSIAPEVSPALDAVVAKALARDREDRFASAHEMAIAIEAASPPVTTREIASWVTTVAGAELERRAAAIAAIERGRAAPSGSVSTRIPSDAPTRTAPTSVSARDVGSASPTSSPNRRRIIAVVAGAGSLALAAAAVLARPSSAPRAAQPDVSQSIAASAAPAPSASEAPSAASFARAVEPPPPMASSAPPLVAPTPSATNPVRRAGRARGPAPAAKACATPYVIDANGVKRYKAECVE